ncbi:MAG: type I glyceraldehyde-3-phosphate dehydrogenase [bacterium]
MSKKIAINGFGRIGKTFLRVLMSDEEITKKINVVAINVGPANPEHTAFQFKHDSILNTFNGKVSYEKEHLIINDHKIKVFAEQNPAKINWYELGIEWVVECSGRFTTKEKASFHLQSGAKKVLITAPATDEDITIIPGVNDSDYDKEKHKIISLGSCTTNCFAPIVKVLKEEFGLQHGLMTTIHAYTNDQVLLDLDHKDLRRSRAAAINIIPTKTGADKVITTIYPEFKNKIKAQAIRVPVAISSLVDFTFQTKKNCNVEEINAAFKKYAANSMKNIIQYCEEPLVSSDFIGNTHSCIIDSLLTQCTGQLGKIFGWYDNEYGYSCRLRDFLLHN